MVALGAAPVVLGAAPVTLTGVALLAVTIALGVGGSTCVKLSNGCAYPRPPCSKKRHLTALWSAWSSRVRLAVGRCTDRYSSQFKNNYFTEM